MVVVDMLRHGHVPRLKEVHLNVVECIVRAMCSDQVYGGIGLICHVACLVVSTASPIFLLFSI